MKLSLSYPTLPFIVNQPFGVNGEYYQKNGIKIQGHNGLDLRAYHGQPIYAAHDGYAYYTSDDGRKGQGIELVSSQEYDYNGKSTYFKTLYWHLCDGDKEPRYASPIYLATKPHRNKRVFVLRGDILGYADNTGLSTGDHLHFGLKPIKQHGHPGYWVNLEPENGYLGAIDPSPYLPKNTPSLWVQAAALAALEQRAGRSKTAAQLWTAASMLRSLLR